MGAETQEVLNAEFAKEAMEESRDAPTNDENTYEMGAETQEVLNAEFAKEAMEERDAPANVEKTYEIGVEAQEVLNAEFAKEAMEDSCCKVAPANVYKTPENNTPTRNLYKSFVDTDFEVNDSMIHDLIEKIPEYLSTEEGKGKEKEAKDVEAKDVEVINLSSDVELQKTSKLVDARTTYKARTRRIQKPSWYLQSPFEVHVEQANVSENARIVADYAWHQQLTEDELMYTSGTRGIFNLTRNCTSTIQKDEWVLSNVIDVFANIMNKNEERQRRRRIYTLVVHELDLLKDVDVEHHIDSRHGTTASQMFARRLRYFPLIDWRSINIRCLQYVFMPALAFNHYVCFVVNLVDRRYEFLTSLTNFKRTSRDGVQTGYQVMGNILVKEATSYIKLRYYMLKIECPYDFSKFTWTDPTMPQQKDTSSCGVFLMKYMQEWHGDSSTMASFKDWPRNKQKKSIATRRTTEFRINLAYEILTNATNEIRSELVTKAKAHYNTQVEKMQESLKKITDLD